MVMNYNIYFEIIALPHTQFFFFFMMIKVKCFDFQIKIHFC